MWIENDRVILRDMIPADVEDRIRWQTSETEWRDWDAPWESDPRSIYYTPFDEMAYRRACAEKLAKPMDETSRRRDFQICVKDDPQTHIGWCSCYTIDSEYRCSPTGCRHAIGIDIPVCAMRHKGYATAAWTLFIAYLFGTGLKELYTQTWSGNERVLGLMRKLGFCEVDRKIGIRFVNAQAYDALTLRLDKRAFACLAHTKKV